MAGSKLPNPLDRRHLIEKELSEAQALALADAYLAAGRSVESIEFLAKAGATERLAELQEQAVRDGDVFLLRSAARAAGVTPSDEQWRDVGAAAAAAGRDAYAAEARRQRGAGGDD